MGWAGASYLADEIWEMVRPLTNNENRRELARKLIKMFEAYDCDTLDECEALMEDAK